MDWDKLKMFYMVAESGTFTSAAEKLNLSQSAISRQINILEEMIGAQLFIRQPRGLLLTEKGQKLFHTTHNVFSQLNDAEKKIEEKKTVAAGKLTINTTVSFGSLWLAPRLKQFAKDYPQIKVHLIVSDDPLDLTLREADIAIRPQIIDRPDLIQKQFISHQLKIYASQKYLDEWGTPQTAEDLVKHRLITFGEDSTQPFQNVNWLLYISSKNGIVYDSYMQINNTFGILQAIKTGSGIGALPDFIAEKEDLVQILNHVSGPIVQNYIVYPRQVREFKKITLFRDYLLSLV